ncbi:hypothetical protein HOY80DRAFT_869359, partial [Tuber brumale]
IEIATSAQERRHGPAFFIHRDIPTPHRGAEPARREIAHFHDSDGYLHVVLSPTDCAEFIESGW